MARQTHWEQVAQPFGFQKWCLTTQRPQGGRDLGWVSSHILGAGLRATVCVSCRPSTWPQIPSVLDPYLCPLSALLTSLPSESGVWPGLSLLSPAGAPDPSVEESVAGPPSPSGTQCSLLSRATNHLEKCTFWPIFLLPFFLSLPPSLSHSPSLFVSSFLSTFFSPSFLSFLLLLRILCLIKVMWFLSLL